MQERSDRDKELMLGFQAGDESCFEQLIERHKQRVFSLVYRFLGGGPDAEDVAQDVFMRVYRAKGSYKPTAKFTTWLYAICRNTCFKELQKRRPIPIALPGEAEDTADDSIHQMGNRRPPSPSDSLLRDEQALVVKAAIDALPDAQRMAVILSKYDQLSYQEIAEVMECSAKAVKSLLYRAREGLRDRLAAYVQEGESGDTSRPGQGLSK
ncbi:MAG: sigma-70 family RNA polymerase sigma factor [Planctomycetota bacterium]